MNRYTAVLRPNPAEGIWYAHLAEEERVHTYGRSVRAALDHLRDAAALWFDVKPTAIELTPDPVVPKRARQSLKQALARRKESDTIAELARLDTINAVRALTKAGLSRRDVAELLGISHQRVHQLVETLPTRSPHR